MTLLLYSNVTNQIKKTLRLKKVLELLKNDFLKVPSKMNFKSKTPKLTRFEILKLKSDRIREQKPP